MKKFIHRLKPKISRKRLKCEIEIESELTFYYFD